MDSKARGNRGMGCSMGFTGMSLLGKTLLPVLFPVSLVDTLEHVPSHSEKWEMRVFLPHGKWVSEPVKDRGTKEHAGYALFSKL